MALRLLAPLNLLAALAVAVPVAIHLLQRRREATLDFPAVRFLLLAQRRASRHLRVRRLLLLLVRCLVVLCFALLLARPVVQAPGAAFREGEPGFTALILDNSLSMTVQSADGRTRFEAARDLARAIAGQAGERERFALIEIAEKPGAPAAPRWLDRESFTAALEAAATRSTPAEPGRSFAEAYRLLREAAGAQQRILVITDGARGGWGRVALSSLTVFDAAVPVRLLRLGRDGAGNRAGVLSIGAHGESSVAGERREIAVEIMNDGPEKVLPVELWIDGKLAASHLETVPPGTTAKVTFTLRPGEAGSHRIEVRLPPDRYPADDRRGIAIAVSPPVGVLMIDGEPGASLVQSETFFLQEALRPERLSTTAPVQVAVGGTEPPAGPIPEGVRLVVLANVRAPGAQAARRLAEHVSSGGSLLVFWGAACDAEAWRREFAGLLPAQVVGTERRNSEEPWRIGALDYDAAPLAIFRPPSGGTFANASFWLRAALATPTPAARVLARFEDGAPWLIEQPVGRGRVVFAASTADLEGNDLATRPVFVPLVQRLIHWLSGSLEAAEDLERIPGDELELTAAPALAGSRVTLVAPGGERREVQFRPDGAVSRAVAPAAGETGFYRWLRPEGEELVAVNVPAAESDLLPLASEELEERLRPVRAELVEVTPAGGAGDPARLGVRSLTRPLLLVLFALLLLEMWVAGPRLSREPAARPAPGA